MRSRTEETSALGGGVLTTSHPNKYISFPSQLGSRGKSWGPESELHPSEWGPEHYSPVKHNSPLGLENQSCATHGVKQC